MNKTVLCCAIVFVVACMNWGLSLRARAQERIVQKEALTAQNMDFQSQLREKSHLRKRIPQDISAAFAQVVNEINMISSSSGLDLTLEFPTVREQSRLESMYVPTGFRGVRGMPFNIKVLQGQGKIDVGAALDLIYVMEHETDLKVSHIEHSGQEMKIQGMVFGL